MTDAPDGKIVKVHTGLTSSRLSAKQFLLAIGTIIIDRELLVLAQNVYDTNQSLCSVYIGSGVILSIIMYIAIKDEAAFYKACNFVDFLYRWIRKSDFVYKHDEKETPDSKIDSHVKVKRMLKNTGIIIFDKCKTYRKNVCNAGFILVVNPQDVQDLDEYNERTSILLYSIDPGTIQKYHSIQSQDMSDIAAQYEERLKLPPDQLSPAERVGLYHTKQFLRNLTGRVNWAYFIFVGVGYYTDDEAAILKVERARKAYEHFLNMSGIESRIITTQREYRLIYKQMSSMKNLGVVTV
ncbi:MAG: hypothetical protein ABFD07_03330 [Methanobacterium sp.]